MHPSQMSTPYPVGRPPYGDPNNSVIGGKMNYSGKHNGLCLYFARILRYEWFLRYRMYDPMKLCSSVIKRFFRTILTVKSNTLLMISHFRPIWDARIFQVFHNKTGKTHTAHVSKIRHDVSSIHTHTHNNSAIV